MDYLIVFLSVLVNFIHSASSELCPFQSFDRSFNIRFRYCAHGCCGHALNNVCCTRPSLELVIGCAAGAVVFIVIVGVIICCAWARSKGRSRHAVRTAIMAPTVYHTEAISPEMSLDNPAMLLPPPYDAATSGYEKPPSYEDVMNGQAGHVQSPDLPVYHY